MRKNKEIRKVVNEKFKPIKWKLMLYTLVYLLIPVAIAFIPFVGSALSSIASIVCVVGFTASVINIYNGNGENESPISFIPHSIKLFTNWICSSLWVCLKCIVGLIITIVGLVLMIVGGASALTLSVMSVQSTEIPIEATAGMSILALVGMLLYFVGLIVFIILELKYACYMYDVIHDDKSGKKAKEIVEESRAHLKGHVGQWFCMGLYYGLLVFCFMIVAGFLVGIVYGFIAAALSSVLDAYALTTFSSVIIFIIEYIALLYFVPKSICACEELHKDLTSNE